MNRTPLDPTNDKDAHILERLHSNLIMWIISTRPDGRPHAVPVWFLWEEGGTLLLFSKPDQKIKNLRANPQVMIALDDTDAGDDVVLLEGEATLLDDDTSVANAPAYAAKYALLLDNMHWTAESMAAQYSQAIRITPTGWLFR